jgi:hypothetical protein
MCNRPRRPRHPCPPCAEETEIETDPEIDLLRRLAGRVNDDALNGFRGYLGAGETTMLGDSLVSYLGDESIPLTDAEHELLSSFVAARPSELARIPRADNVFPTYEFDSGADTPKPVEVDTWIVEWLASVPAARRLSRAYRRPEDPTATGQATWVYLLELAPEGRIALIQSQVPIGAATNGVVEVFATGESLPPYHVEALRAAVAVWSRHT